VTDDIDAYATRLNVAYETLSDPLRRSAYDEILKRDQAHRTSRSSTPAISCIVSLADFAVNEDGDVFSFPSRCGVDFKVGEEDLEAGNGELVLACEGCTERIQVVYTIEGEDDEGVDR